MRINSHDDLDDFEAQFDLDRHQEIIEKGHYKHLESARYSKNNSDFDDDSVELSDADQHYSSLK